MHRLTGRAGAVCGLLLAVALLFVSIDVGLRVPDQTSLDPFGSSSSLDYRALRFGSFAPLRGEFIEKELGSIIERRPVFEKTRRTIFPGRLEGVAAPVTVAHRFTNDNIEQAYPIATVPFTARTNTRNATKQSGEPASCAPLGGGGTAWYRYHTKAPLGLIANTFGSAYGTALAVYSGRSLRELVRIGCDSDAGGFAQVAFAARPDITYWFQIDGTFGGGDLVFSLALRGVLTLASLDADGGQGNADAQIPSISGDGAFVSFYSASTTYTENPPDPLCVTTPQFDLCRPSLYARDRRAHSVRQVDVSPPSDPVRQYAPHPLRAEPVSVPGSISEDGRYIAFWSTRRRLVPNDTNQDWDVFVRDQRTGKVERVSVSSSGDQGNGSSYEAAMSLDGRFVAFTSTADTLVPGDTNGVPDVFVRDRQTASTMRVSISSSGTEANTSVSRAFVAERGSRLVSMSANGRYVLFRSVASNLVSDDTNEAADVFVRDVRTRKTIRVNVSSSEGQANGDTRHPVGIPQWNVSDDGRFAFFNSDASNLVANDTNASEDIFVRDIVRGVTQRVSISSTGGEAEFGVGDRDQTATIPNYLANASVVPTPSSALSYAATPNGRYVVFSSDSTDLVPGDNNDLTDIFLRDLGTGTTTLVSIATTGEQGNGPSNVPVLSADGSFVAFDSSADNLVPGDENGSEDIFVFEVPGLASLSGWY